jgi:hypothetical protein
VPDQELPDTIRSPDLCDELNYLRVPVSAIPTNNQEASFDTLWNGKEDTCNERFAVVFLLEDDDLLAKSRAGQQLIVEI